MTQLELAKLNKVSPEMRYTAKNEGMPLELLKNRIEEGSVVLIKNTKRKIKPCAVGKGLRVKINANIGTSRHSVNLNKELKKLRIAIECGADTVMDLSTGENICEIRKAIDKIYTPETAEPEKVETVDLGSEGPRRKAQDLLEPRREQHEVLQSETSIQGTDAN